MSCPVCRSSQDRAIYSQAGVPLFQNRLFPDPLRAKEAPSADILLSLCQDCGFIWNRAFEPDRLQYDSEYENEQALSPAFQGHLEQVLEVLQEQGIKDGRVIEIGCGKGAFLEKLWTKGVRAQGFDPAYSGQDPRVIRKYFSKDSGSFAADWIVLRHVLEHVPAPVHFLQTIAEANENKGKIYIEVPDFQWIVRKKAFWDIYYEHCNYFTPSSLKSLFGTVHASGHLFAGQYFYLIADLESLGRAAVRPSASHPDLIDLQDRLQQERKRYQQVLLMEAPVYLWGAGAKGTTLCRSLDPAQALIAGLIDINPRKQGRFVPLTGHRVCDPEELADRPGLRIWVMNENYLQEVRDVCRSRGFNIQTLGRN